MAIRTKKFVWDEVKEGWRPASNPNFDPGNGFLATHDTLEHFNDDGSFEGELLAFGSTMFGRMYCDAQQAWVSSVDLTQFLKEQKFKVDTPNYRWDKPLPDDAERTLNLFMQISTERLYQMGLPAPKIRELLKDVSVWVRLGYRIAERRYRGHTHDDAVDAYIRMNRAIDNDHDENPPKKGDTLTVRFDTNTLDFRLERGRMPSVSKRAKKVKVEA